MYRKFADLSREFTKGSLLIFIFVMALGTLKANQASPPASCHPADQIINSGEEIRVYGLYLIGEDAEGIEQSFWIALFAGTEEAYRESWVHNQLTRHGSEGMEGLTPGQVQEVLDEVGILEHCFSEGSAEGNCLYYCDPETSRRVKRICFMRSADGGLIAVTIDPIIEEGLTSREIMQRIAEQPEVLDQIRGQLEEVEGPSPSIVFPEGREFDPR